MKFTFKAARTYEYYSILKIKEEYPYLWKKLVGFFVLNIFMQSAPITAGVLSALFLGKNVEISASDLVVLSAFSWMALPSFLDSFSWSEGRRSKYASQAYAIGFVILFAATLSKESDKTIAYISETAHGETIERIQRFARFIGKYLAPSFAVSTLLLVHIFLIHAHKKLLYKIRLRLRWRHQAQFAGFYVSKARGLYERAGLDVAIRDRNLQKPLINMISSREDEFGIIMAPEAVQFAANGVDLIAVEIFSAISPLEIIINESSFRKKIENGQAVTVLSVKNYFECDLIKGLLVDERANVARFEISYYSDNHIAQEFLENKFDLIAAHRANEKIFLQREMSGEKWFAVRVINPSEKQLTLWGETLVTSEVFARDNPKVVEAMKSASIAGWDMAREDPDFAAELSYRKVLRTYSAGQSQSSMLGGIEHQKSMLKEMIYMYERGRDIRGRQTEYIWQKIIDSCKHVGIIQNNSTIRPEKIIGSQ